MSPCPRPKFARKIDHVGEDRVGGRYPASGLCLRAVRVASPGLADTLIAPLSGAAYETLVGDTGEGRYDATQIGSARTPGRLKMVIGNTVDRLNAFL